MKLIDIYWRVFNFLARRVVASCFAVGGLIIAGSNLYAILGGGADRTAGHISDDIVLRVASIAVPLLMAVAGVLLYLSEPYKPKEQAKVPKCGA